jgi:hypothetical protein
MFLKSRAKNRQKGQKWANRSKPQENCGNQTFSVDFACPKPHCNERQGSSKPHEYRGFVLRLPRSHPLHAVRISRRKPVNKGSPEGSPRRRTFTWQLDSPRPLLRHLAEKLELTNKQSAAFLDLLAETAIKETKKNGVFVIPGIGRS